MNAISINVTTEVIEVEGELTRQHLNKAFITTHSECFKPVNVTVDLSKVSRIDTAGLAWLLTLIENSSSPNDFKFKSLPSELLKLAKLSGVEDLLSLA